MRKGLWSPEEDEKLKQYILKHGYHSWREVPKKAGLQRCGKSCRLRWINYLKPGLRRNNFSSEEINLVMELHKIYGNRWSKIAGYMEGRTDNGVKNLWHSQIKKHLGNINKQKHMLFDKLGCSNACPKSSMKEENKEQCHVPHQVSMQQHSKQRVFPFNLDLDNIGICGTYQHEPSILEHYTEKSLLSKFDFTLMHTLKASENNHMEYSGSGRSSTMINVDDSIEKIKTTHEWTKSQMPLELTTMSYSCPSLSGSTNHDQDQEDESLDSCVFPVGTWCNQDFNNEMMGLADNLMNMADGETSYIMSFDHHKIDDNVQHVLNPYIISSMDTCNMHEYAHFQLDSLMDTFNMHEYAHFQLD